MSTFDDQLLEALNLPNTPNNQTFLHIWQQAEGGNSYNPFNTTMPAPGATNLPGNSAGVKVYPSQIIGVDATAQTLSEPPYAGILSAMRASDIKAAAQAVVASPWGTSPQPLLSLAGDTQGDTVPQGITGGAATGIAQSVTNSFDWVKNLGHITADLRNGRWWLRIGQALAAIALLFVAVALIFRKQMIAGTMAAATDGFE